MATESVDGQSHVLADVAHQPVPSSPRCSASPTVVSALHDGAEDVNTSSRASPAPSTDASQTNQGDILLKLPSLERLLPDDIFQRMLDTRESTPPLTSGTDPALFQTTGRRDSSSQVTTIFTTYSPPSEQHSPTIHDCSDPSYSRSGSGIGGRSQSVSPGSCGIQLVDVPYDDERVHGGHGNGIVAGHHPPLEYSAGYSTHWHYPDTEMWDERRPRSSSPVRRPDPEPQVPESTGNTHGPKTRKAWTNFEREVIKEYCIRLLKTPEYAGETVLPPDPEIWEDIKDALWDMYPGRFQRSRQGIMELARKMNLRRGTREELSKRQTRPKELFKSQIASHHLQHHTNRAARRKSIPTVCDDGMVNAPR